MWAGRGCDFKISGPVLNCSAARLQLVHRVFLQRQLPGGDEEADAAEGEDVHATVWEAGC